MKQSTQILGISGSLRRQSYNSALLRTAGDLMPDHMHLTIFDLNPLPMFNPDLHGNPTQEARAFLDAVHNADGLIIASPEYNHSLTGALKNAIDWASRRFDGQPPPLSGKPVGLMAAATGGYGGVRGFQHLRDVAYATKMHVLNRPMILVPRVREKFDDDLNLTDDVTRGFLQDFVTALDAWVQKINAD